MAIRILDLYGSLIRHRCASLHIIACSCVYLTIQNSIPYKYCALKDLVKL